MAVNKAKKNTFLIEWHDLKNRNKRKIVNFVNDRRA